jgi:N-methylhydantoinase A
VAQGADPEGIEVRVEVDRGRGLLRAVAVGAHAIDGGARTLDEADLVAHAAALMGVEPSAVEVASRPRGFLVGSSRVTTSRLFGLLRSERRPYVVVDLRGRPRALASDGRMRSCSRADLPAAARLVWDECAAVGDAGVLLPPSVVVADGRVVDVGGLLTAEQRLAVLAHDLAGLAPDAPVVVCAERRR